MAAPRLVGLLRGVNVGGRGAISMADLRSCVESLGHTDVTTYIQSGNLVFTSGQPAGTVAARGRVAREIEHALATNSGLRTTVMIRSVPELRTVVDEMPFAGDEREPTRLVTVFLAEAPTADAVASLERDRFPERFAVHGREMFVHYVNGQGRSKFTPAYFERRLGVAGTARNANTVRKLLDMATA
jgi:uncharacterized protein (DUF1697 family)